MFDEAILKAYQDALASLLEQGLEPDDVLARLRKDPRFESIHEYIDSIDADMLQVASELQEKGGLKHVDDC